MAFLRRQRGPKEDLKGEHRAPGADRLTVRPFDCPADRPTEHTPSDDIPHLFCRESYHLGSNFGITLDPFGDGLGRLREVFLVILGLLKFVKNSPIESLWGV